LPHYVFESSPKTHHNRFEEHDDHDASHTSHTLESGDENDEDTADDGVDHEQERGRHDGKKSSSEESSDGEEDQTVRQELSSLSIGNTLLGAVVDEEGTDGDLSSDVHELGEETPWSFGPPESLVGIGDNTLGETGLGKSISLGLESGLGGLGKLGADESDDDGDTEECDGEVDPLNVGEVVLVTTGEEILGGDERTGE
jgi:hypothetical protein